jgi:ATP-dependent Clp protease ATP-binding subunit ClpA
MFRVSALNRASRGATASAAKAFRTAQPLSTNFSQPHLVAASSSLLPYLTTTTTTNIGTDSFNTRRFFSSGPPPPGGGGGPQNLGSIFGTNPQSGSFLQDFTVDLTELARQQHDKNNKMDPIIGRHEEIRRCLQILARRTKNNPVLIGQAGVGKSE